MAEVQKIRVLIADDHPILRAGLRKLLEAEPDFEVVGEAADGAEAVRRTRERTPDILLLDLAMPRVSGFQALHELAAAQTSVRTIIFTASIEKEEMVKALQLGAWGVILKDAAIELLFKSIRRVMSGEHWVSQEAIAGLVHALRAHMHGPSAAAPRSDGRHFSLSPRELEVVARVVTGCSNKEIAGEFSLSENTVKHHLSKIFDKVGVSNRLELALYVVHHRVLDHIPLG